MLEIRTVIVPTTLQGKFDNEVNGLLKEGWELVRRDVLPPYEGECSVVPQRLYAELERIVDEPDTDDTDDDGDEEDDDAEMGIWEIARDPTRPFRCSKCGYKASAKWPTCPNCGEAKTIVRTGE